MFLRSILLASAASTVLVMPAMAQTAATATTDLNLRVGPGPGFAVVDVIPADAEVMVEGCTDDRTWCEVSHAGLVGWASGGYLNAVEDSKPFMGSEAATAVTVETVTYEPATSDDEAALGLGSVAAAAGFLIAGPVGAAAGAALGLVGGPLTNPDGEVVTYVTVNPVEPVYLGGEVVIGAIVPEAIALYDTPAPEVRYATINGQTVLVEAESRQIVHILR